MLSPLLQHAKVRVVNEITGREWVGYLTEDLNAMPEGLIRLVLTGSWQRLSLRIDWRYRIEDVA